MDIPSKTNPVRSIQTKILVAFLGLSLVALVLFGFIALSSLQELGDYSEESSNDLGESAIEDSELALRDLGQDMIRQTATDVAKQLEIYIKDHPDMNVTQLQEDPVFSALAVQQVGETGYTAITDVNSLFCRFHVSAVITNMDLHALADSRPGFWSIMAQTEGGQPAQGYYDWEEDDGSIKEKYMHISIVNATTSDGVTFSVAATTYIAEFSAPVEKTRDRIDAATLESTGHIDDEIKKTQFFFLIMFIPMIVVVVFGAVFLSKKITTPIQTLTEGARMLGSGDLEHRVTVETGDELEELANSFNRMAADLKTHLETIKRATKEKERIERELQIAKEIQTSFLPLKAPEVPGYRMAGMNIPAKEVGGDFYDFIELPDGRMGIVIADVSGKGVPAALFMGISKTLLRANAKRILDPVEALLEVNSTIMEESDSGMFVTLFYAILDPKEHILTYINAGHNPPLLLNKGAEEITLLKAKGIPVGVMEDMPLESKEIRLEESATIFLYTDGVTEAVNEKDEEFGTQRLNGILNQGGDGEPKEIIDMVAKEIKDFAGSRDQFDDITMVVVHAEEGRE